MGINVLALIPARGGSKTIPDKNIQYLGDHPLIAYSIRIALRTPSITRVIVTTDSKKIASISRKYDAEVPFLRPSELAQDNSPDNGFFSHVIKWLYKNESYAADLIVHLRPTTPFRTPSLVDKAIQMMVNTSAMDSLRSVHKISLTPYKLFQIQDGCLKGFFSDHHQKEYHNLPRQLFPQTYVANGYVDIIRPDRFQESGLLHGNKIYPFEIVEPVVDIDTYDDLLKAQRLLTLEPWRSTVNLMFENAHD